MGTTADKLSYLAETKSKLKDTINYTGAGIDANTTFRNYDKKLYDGLLNSLADSSTLYSNLPKVGVQTGTSVQLTGTGVAPMRLSLAPSELSQDSTPSPSSPQTIHSITGNNTITIANSDNTKTQNVELNLGTEEYCKIGNYADDFIKTSGKNLMPLTNQNFTINNVSFKVQNGSIVLNGTTNANITGFIMNTDNYFPITLDAGTYYFKRNLTNRTVGLIKANNTVVVSLISTSTETSTRFTLTEKTTLYFFFYIASGTAISNEAWNIMVSKEDTDYEPYGTGEWWIKKNIGKVVLDENENWQERTNNGGHKQFYCLTSARNIKQENQKCNYGVFDNATFNWSTEGKFALLYNTYTLYLGVNDNAVLNDFKTTIASNNVVVYYPLATPTFTLLSDTLQEQLEHIYNELLSYSPQTNISQTNADLPFVITANGIKSYDNI